MTQPHTLIVEDDANALQALVELVEREGFTAACASSLQAARDALRQQAPDLVLTDLMLPDGTGMDLVKDLRPSPTTQVVVITGFASIDTAVEAMRMGASDFLTKPIEIPRLKAVLSNASRTLELETEVTRLRAELRHLGRFGLIVGASPEMQRLYELAGRVAPTEAAVLLTGESGTGKDLLAQTLHLLSKRRKGPYLPVNCGAIPPNLIESELFGHERGSFTGAERTHRGFFERASGGTLFLDEVTELPIEFQVKLLRVLESGTCTRVGGEEPVHTDVRVIAATNRSPHEAVTAGRLRRDLFYRLKVFSLHLPALRERGDDVVALAQHFLATLNETEDTNKTFAEDALQCLRSYHWPGNVRELQNVVQHAFILGDSTITASCLPEDMFAVDGHAIEADRQSARSNLQVPLGTSLADAERDLILATLEDTGGDKKKAARILGISLKTLYNRLNAYASSTPN